MPDILISEIFGPTIQGEGALAGRLTVFVRTGGCDSRCNWCVAPETPILLEDRTEKAAGAIEVGDKIWGMARRAGVPEAIGPYQVGTVEGVARRRTTRARVRFEDGRELVGAHDHALTMFGSGRFKTLGNLHPGDEVRALLPVESFLETPDYKRGYLAGAADGDGSFHAKVQAGIWHFVIATKDKSILERFHAYACSFDFHLQEGRHLSGGDFAPAQHIPCLRLTRTLEAQRLRAFLSEDAPPSCLPFWRGYLAGITDTDGSSDGKTWRVHQSKQRVRDRIKRCFDALFLPYVQEENGFRLTGGLGAMKKLSREVRPAVERKAAPYFARYGGHREVARVASIESIEEGEVVSIKTSLGTYISNGFLSRNCDTLYAVLPEFKRDWTPMSATQIIERIEEHSFGRPILVTISGGNPALWPLGELLKLGQARGHTFALETQGTKSPEWLGELDFLTLSPKPPSSGMTFDLDSLRRCVEVATRERKTRVSLKIVVFDEADYEFARGVWREFPGVPFYLSVGTAPVSSVDNDENQITRGVEWLIERAARDGWMEAVILPQIHVLLWGQKRGV